MAQIATAAMSLDTLKIKGMLEGETFVTIISHDKRMKLKINVTFPELGISHSTVELRPGFEEQIRKYFWRRRTEQTGRERPGRYHRY